MTGKRKAAITAFIIFLIFMALCTLIARGIYTQQLPIITVEMPSRRSITHTVEVRGSVRQGQEYGIYTEEGLRVAAIFKEKGDPVQEGDALFLIDLTDLNRQMEETQLQIEKLRLQQKSSEEAEKIQSRAQEKNLARAQEDYGLAVRDGELAIARARLLYTQACEKLEAFRKKEAYGGNAVSCGDAALDQEAWQEELAVLEQACAEAEQAVEDAILAKEAALLQANRNIEDVKEASLSAASPSEAALDIAYQQARLQELEELYEADGMIYASVSGWLIDVKLKVGERTADGAAMLYCMDDGERILEMPLTAEQAEHVELLDTVRLTFNTESGVKKEGTAVISYLEESDGSFIARARLEEDAVRIGQFITCSISKTSESYETCIPVSALYSNGMGGYIIYVTEEKEGILGTQSYIRKLDVNVLDQNERTAAIEGTGISQETRVVVGADKSFAPGDVVRVAE